MSNQPTIDLNLYNQPAQYHSATRAPPKQSRNVPLSQYQQNAASAHHNTYNNTNISIQPQSQSNQNTVASQPHHQLNKQYNDTNTLNQPAQYKQSSHHAPSPMQSPSQPNRSQYSNNRNLPQHDTGLPIPLPRHTSSPQQHRRLQPHMLQSTNQSINSQSISSTISSSTPLTLTSSDVQRLVSTGQNKIKLGGIRIKGTSIDSTQPHINKSVKTRNHHTTNHHDISNISADKSKSSKYTPKSSPDKDKQIVPPSSGDKQAIGNKSLINDAMISEPIGSSPELPVLGVDKNNVPIYQMSALDLSDYVNVTPHILSVPPLKLSQDNQLSDINELHELPVDNLSVDEIKLIEQVNITSNNLIPSPLASTDTMPALEHVASDTILAQSNVINQLYNDLTMNESLIENGHKIDQIDTLPQLFTGVELNEWYNDIRVENNDEPLMNYINHTSNNTMDQHSTAPAVQCSDNMSDDESVLIVCNHNFKHSQKPKLQIKLQSHNNIRSLQSYDNKYSNNLPVHTTSNIKHQWSTVHSDELTDEAKYNLRQSIHHLNHHIQPLNINFLSMSWLNNIIWSTDELQTKSDQLKVANRVLVDINDEYIIHDNIDTTQHINTTHDIELIDFEKTFNISDDIHYITVDDNGGTNAAAQRIVHSIPAQQLHDTIYIPPRTSSDLLAYHRYKLRLSNSTVKESRAGAALNDKELADGLIGGYGHRGQHMIKINHPMSINTYDVSIHTNIPSTESLSMSTARLSERYIPKQLTELSIAEGTHIVFEYIEQHPMLLSNTGMCSKLITYYRKSHDLDFTQPSNIDDNSELVVLDLTDESPLLADIKPGQSVLTLTNNLYIAPVAKQTCDTNIFILVRYSSNITDEWIIRDIPQVYLVGQCEPKRQVPQPGKQMMIDIESRIIESYIYRQMYINSELRKGYIVYDHDISEAFGSGLYELHARKLLNSIAAYESPKKKSDLVHGAYWQLNSGMDKLTDDKLQLICTAEDICVYESCKYQQQLLIEYGIYKEIDVRTFTPIVQQLKQNTQFYAIASYIEYKLQSTAWYLSKCYLDAKSGKGILQLTGRCNPIADGIGMSFINTSQSADTNKPSRSQHTQADNQLIDKLVPERKTGTDADLRKLTVEQTKHALIRLGMDSDTVSHMSRWERVRAIAGLSREATLEGRQRELQQYARNVRDSSTDQYKQYKRKLQSILERQLQYIQSSHSDYTHDATDDAYMKYIQHINKTNNSNDIQKLSKHNEEQEYKQLMNELRMNRQESIRNDIIQPIHNTTTVNQHVKKTKKIRQLVIKKTIMRVDVDGTEHADITMIRDTFTVNQLIKQHQLTLANASSKASTTHNIVRTVSTVNPASTNKSRASRNKPVEYDEYGNPIKRAKKQNIELQQKRQAERERKKAEKRANSKIKCSMCGERGHTRTSPICPFNRVNNTQNDIHNNNTDISSSTLIHADDDGKLKLNVRGMSRVESSRGGTRRKSNKSGDWSGDSTDEDELVLNSTIDTADTRKRKKRAATNKSNKRNDPRIQLNQLLESVTQKLILLPQSESFRQPVNRSFVPDYYNIISDPIDLSTIKSKSHQTRYNYIDDYLNDLQLMYDNCVKYNGIQSVLVEHAGIVQLKAKEYLTSKQENRDIIDTANQYVNTYILHDRLMSALDAMYDHSDSTLFVSPVNASQVPTYYQIISRPMSLNNIKLKTEKHMYRTTDEFITDIQLIVDNSILFNGGESNITQQARNIYDTAINDLNRTESTMSHKPSNITLDQYTTPLLPELRSVTPSLMNHNNTSNTPRLDYAADTSDSMLPPTHQPNRTQSNAYINITPNRASTPIINNSSRPPNSNKLKIRLSSTPRRPDSSPPNAEHSIVTINNNNLTPLTIRSSPQINTPTYNISSPSYTHPNNNLNDSMDIGMDADSLGLNMTSIPNPDQMAQLDDMANF